MRRTLGRRCGRRAAARAVRATGRARIDFGPILQLVLAIDDHGVAGIQTCTQAHTVPCRLSDGDRANLRSRVFGRGIFSNRINVSSLGSALNGGGGDDSEIKLCVHEKVDIHKLIGEERVVGVVKYGFELVSSSRRINLIVDGLEPSAGDFRGVVTVKGIDDKLNAGTEFGVHLRKLVLRQAENYLYGLELGDDEKSIRVRCMHDVAGVDETQTDAPADWRGDAGIRELQLGVVNLALV